MKKYYFLFFTIIFFSSLATYATQDNPSVLVFGKTAGYQHESIPYGFSAITKLGKLHGFGVDTTRNSDVFDLNALKKYKAVIFLSTSGDVLNNDQQNAFEQYIRSGGNYMGIHGASATEYGWPWYGELVGAVFDGHPAIQKGMMNIVDRNHISTKHLPKQWYWEDEWYNFKNINKKIHVLITVDEKTYEGGINGKDHPIAWYHEFEGARSFYTAIGHLPQHYVNPEYLKHILGGIQYVIDKH